MLLLSGKDVKSDQFGHNIGTLEGWRELISVDLSDERTVVCGIIKQLDLRLAHKFAKLECFYSHVLVDYDE